MNRLFRNAVSLYLPSADSFAGFFADESGQDLIEYALVAALIGLAAVTSVRGVAGKISNSFNSIGTSLTSNI